MLSLKHSPSLCDFQNYVYELEIERGFAKETLPQKCLLLGEEVGELCEAVRQHEAEKSTNIIAGELADVLVILLAVANRLETADSYITLQQRFTSFVADANDAFSSFSQIQQVIPLASHTDVEFCLELTERNGLLFKAIRKTAGIKLDASLIKGVDANQRLTEMLLTLCRIANKFQLDLEQSFREKEAINKTRKWKL